jgi:hypothetical protein
VAPALGAAYGRSMADYTLKLYRRLDASAPPGQLIGRYAFSADGNAEAIDHATTSFAVAIKSSDYAIIGGLHGRFVWEKGPRS